jgi:type III pantothenate kinase
MKILVDIGNTRLKWGVEQASVFQFKAAIDYRSPEAETLLESAWQNLDRPEKIMVSCVAQAAVFNNLQQWCAKLWPGLQAESAVSGQAALGVVNAYRQPEKLGIDRWLSLLAAHQFYPGLTCIADCGTAITVDVLEANGQHLGGLIMPGLQSMKKSLKTDTANLDYQNEIPKFVLADNTIQAINSGALLAAAGMIEAVLGRISSSAQLLMSGGDAAAVAEEIKFPGIIIDEFLVFKGLQLYCRLVEQT